MLVSDGSTMKHVEVSDGAPIRFVGLRWVLDGPPIGLRPGMSVSDGCSIVIFS